MNLNFPVVSSQLSDVEIKRSDPDSPRLTAVDDWTFKMALERNALRFSFQDGLVDDVCPSDQEVPRSLNFKRGVLSAFQNSMTQHRQKESMREVGISWHFGLLFHMRIGNNGKQLTLCLPNLFKVFLKANY